MCKRVFRFIMGILAWCVFVYAIFTGVELYSGTLYMQDLPTPEPWFRDVRDWISPPGIYTSAYTGFWMFFVIFYAATLMFWWRFKTWWTE